LPDYCTPTPTAGIQDRKVKNIYQFYHEAHEEYEEVYISVNFVSFRRRSPFGNDLRGYNNHKYNIFIMLNIILRLRPAGVVAYELLWKINGKDFNKMTVNKNFINRNTNKKAG
jgi:hypothetical protein